MRRNTEDEEAGLEPPTIVAALGSGALALLYAVTALLPPVAAEQTLATLGAFLVVAFVGLVFTLGLFATTLGLLLRKPWGWIFGLVFHAAGVLYQLRYLFFYVPAVNWDHPRAPRLALEIGLRYGLPFLVSLAVLVVLFLPGVRRTFGFRQEAYRRRRKALRSRP